MVKILEICEGENNARSHTNPSPEIIDRAIDDLIPAIYHFVIFEAEPSIDKCAYIQALIEREGRNRGDYLIETRYAFSGGFRHYRKHAGDAGEVKKLFRLFAEGVMPNTAGWDDITEKMTSATG